MTAVPSRKKKPTLPPRQVSGKEGAPSKKKREANTGKKNEKNP